MTPWLMARPGVTPFRDPRTAHPPGLAPLDPAEWVVTGPDYAAQMAERRRVIAAFRDLVLACRSEAERAAAELLAMMVAHLGRHPEFEVSGSAVRRPDGVAVTRDGPPLAVLGRLVAEDFCLMMPAQDAEMWLGGAVLCFPSRWSLAEKLGRPLTEIHAPVPQYAETMGRRVNRVFAAIRPGMPLVRANWMLHASAELHRPLTETVKTEAERPETAPASRLFLRTERQTLTRLPESGAVAFGIRTHITPLERLDGDARRDLLAAMDEVGSEDVMYRGGPAIWDAARATLKS